MEFVNIRAWQEAKGVVLSRGFMWLASLQKIQEIHSKVHPYWSFVSNLNFRKATKFSGTTSKKNVVFLQEFGVAFGFQKNSLVERFKGTRPMPWRKPRVLTEKNPRPNGHNEEKAHQQRATVARYHS